jgi:hypothetical protein
MGAIAACCAGPFGLSRQAHAEPAGKFDGVLVGHERHGLVGNRLAALIDECIRQFVAVAFPVEDRAVRVLWERARDVLEPAFVVLLGAVAPPDERRTDLLLQGALVHDEGLVLGALHVPLGEQEGLDRDLLLAQRRGGAPQGRGELVDLLWCVGRPHRAQGFTGDLDEVRCVDANQHGAARHGQQEGRQALQIQALRGIAGGGIGVCRFGLSRVGLARIGLGRGLGFRLLGTRGVQQSAKGQRSQGSLSQRGPKHRVRPEMGSGLGSGQGWTDPADSRGARILARSRGVWLVIVSYSGPKPSPSPPGTVQSSSHHGLA